MRLERIPLGRCGCAQEPGPRAGQLWKSEGRGDPGALRKNTGFREEKIRGRADTGSERHISGMFGRPHFIYLLKLYGLCLLAQLVLRISFILFHLSSIVPFSFSGCLHSVFTGLIFDSAVSAAILFILLLLFIPLQLVSRRNTPKLFYIFSSVVFSLVFFINLTDIFFFNQFGTRLNLLATEAGTDPGKILPTIWKTYPVIRAFLLYGIFLVLFILLHRKIYRQLIRQSSVPSAGAFRWGAFSFLTLGALSFLYYGPPLWTLAGFSHSPVLNQASMNGVYTLAKSWLQQKIYEKDIPAYSYGEESAALKTLQDSILSKKDSLLNPLVPTLRCLRLSDSADF